MTPVPDLLSASERAQLGEEAEPGWAAPMLATLTERRFADANWLYERKFDGERALVVRCDDDIRLMTRNQKDISNTYPELVEALAGQACSRFVADGEIVAFDGPLTSFARLQQRMQIKDPAKARNSGVAVHYYLFDLLHLDGYGLDQVPLRARKKLLKRAIAFDDPLRFTPHRNKDGLAYYRDACEKGWEGVIAKRADASYRHSRSRDWLKFKCAKGQELVIGGFTEPQGSRKGFGALLVGYYDQGRLRYAGKVGTGYDDDLLETLRARLDRIARETAPFADEVKENGVTWVTPKLVAEFGFTEWTRAGKLRHPRFLGLRRDKDARDVVREGAEEDT